MNTQIDYPLISFHIGCLLASTIIFLASLRFGLLENVVFFYRGLIILFLLTVLLACILVYFYAHKTVPRLQVKDIVMAVILFACLNLAFFVTVPVVLERSISVHLLGSVLYDSDPISTEEVEEQFINEYVIRNEAMEKRLHEQLISGNIAVDSDGNYVLTKRGELVVRLLFLLDHVLIPPKKDGPVARLK